MLAKLLDRLAGQTAQVLNIDRAARGTGLDPTTTESYVRLLAAVFVVYRLPAWGRALGARAAATPKALRDPAVLTELGHILETFAVGELLKQASWAAGTAGVGHWRTHDHDEVDLVVERDDGAVIALEVETAARVGGDDFGPLRKLRSLAGDSLLLG